MKEEIALQLAKLAVLIRELTNVVGTIERIAVITPPPVDPPATEPPPVDPPIDPPAPPPPVEPPPVDPPIEPPLPPGMLLDQSGRKHIVNEKGEVVIDDVPWPGSVATEPLFRWPENDDTAPIYHMGSSGNAYRWREDGSGFDRTADPRKRPKIVVGGPTGKWEGLVPVPPRAVSQYLLPPGTAVNVPSLFLGLHIGANVEDWLNKGRWRAGASVPKPTYPYDFARMMTCDVDGKSQVGFWSQIETAPGVYNWSLLDKWVAHLEGRPILATIYGTPSFYQKYPNESSRWPKWKGIGSGLNAEGLKAATKFTRALKQRYPQIFAFESSNEPTFPWGTTANDFTTRWSPEWMRATPNTKPGFFTGSPSDLADFTAAIDEGAGDTLVLGCAFVDVWSAGNNVVERFLNAPTQRGTRGRDHIDGLTVHTYDYAFTPKNFVSHIDGYRAKLNANGLPDMPIYNSEVGAEDQGRFRADGSDPRAVLNVPRWILINAAKSVQFCTLYAHRGADDMETSLGSPDLSLPLIENIRKVHSVTSGKKLVGGAILDDNSVWVATSDGTTLVL